MPFLTTDYQPSINKPYRAGTVLDIVSNNRINTYNASGGVIPYGSALVRGTDDYNHAVLPTATGGEFIGIAVREILYENNYDVNGDVGYPSEVYFTRLTSGIIAVEIETDIAIGDPVFFRHTDNGALVGNKFRNDADTTNADQILAGAKWFKPGTASQGYALLELNLPV